MMIGWWRRLLAWWRRLQCRHDRTVRFLPDGVTWFFRGSRRGPHSTIVVDGCLGCGRVVVRDYGE